MNPIGIRDERSAPAARSGSFFSPQDHSLIAIVFIGSCCSRPHLTTHLDQHSPFRIDFFVTDGFFLQVSPSARPLTPRSVSSFGIRHLSTKLSRPFIYLLLFDRKKYNIKIPSHSFSSSFSSL